MPETRHPPAEEKENAPQLNPDFSEDNADLDADLDDELLDAFLPDDGYEPHPEWGDFWIERG